MTIQLKNFGKLGSKYTLNIYNRQGDKQCSFKSENAKSIEKCSGSSSQMVKSKFEIIEDNGVFKKKKMFKKTLMGLNEQVAQIWFHKRSMAEMMLVWVF